MKNFLYIVLSFAAFLIVGCSRIPSDIFPKNVGLFQLSGNVSSTKYEGHKYYGADYISPDNKKIGCGGFDASTEEEANTFVKEYGIRDESQPILDKSGKQTGLKLLGPWSPDNSTWSVRWHQGIRAYRCVTDSDNPEETVKKFYAMWQEQISK